MARLNEIKERRANIACERAEIAEHLARMDAAAQDEETEARWREKIDRNAALSKEDARLAQLEALEAANAEAERRAHGTPVGGGAPAMEVRVFQGGATPLPQGFDGEVLVGQDGSRVPLLEQRHRLSDFARGEARSAAQELGLGGFLKALHFGPATELERRALAEGAPGTGGVLVPTPLSSEVIDLLTARSVAFQAGARLVPMSSQTLRLARVTAYPAGSWRAELAAIAQDQPAFDSVTLTAKSWALIVRVSRELLEDGQNIDGTLRNVFSATAALALDQAILFGTGAGNQPTGIFNQSGVHTISLGTNGAALTATWAPILDALVALEMANAPPPTAMVYSPRTSRTLNGFLDATGQPLTLPPSIANIPRLVTTAVPVNQTQGTSNNASSVLIGHFPSVLVGMRTQLQITTLGEKYADTGEIGFCLWLRADVALTQGPAMAKITGIVP